MSSQVLEYTWRDEAVAETAGGFIVLVDNRTLEGKELREFADGSTLVRG